MQLGQEGIFQMHMVVAGVSEEAKFPTMSHYLATRFQNVLDSWDDI